MPPLSGRKGLGRVAGWEQTGMSDHGTAWRGWWNNLASRGNHDDGRESTGLNFHPTLNQVLLISGGSALFLVNSQVLSLVSPKLTCSNS